MNFLNVGRSIHSRKYRPDIDGLRAVAVTAVVIYHAFPHILPGGFVGVDIFFVISGYLISSILLKNINNDSFSIARFYNRRIRRIFPALIAVLLFIILVGWFCLFNPEFVVLGKHVVASTLFSENFLLWSQSGYFDAASASKPTLHLWSLAIEEQFYIFWPILMYLAYRKRLNIAFILLCLGGLSFAVNLYDLTIDPAAAYYSPLGRFWELMIGSGLAYIHFNESRWLSTYKNTQACLGLALILAAIFFIKPDYRFPGFWALLPTVGSLLLISSSENAWINRHLLAIAPMVWCGLISYPLYLWHWPLLSHAHIALGWLSTRNTLILVALSVVASIVTFLAIERPFRQRGADMAKAVGLAVVMLVPLTAGAVLMQHLVPPRLNHFRVATHNEWDYLIDRTPDFDRNTTGIFRLEADRDNLALLIGDSHIAQYASRLDRVISGDPSRPGAVLAIGGGCIPIEGVTTDNIRRAQCWPQRKKAYRMAREDRFQTIVIGAAWNWYFLTGDYRYDVDGKKIPLTSAAGRKAAMARLRQSIETLKNAGKEVVLLLDNPHDRKLLPDLYGIRLSLSQHHFKPNRTTHIDNSQLELHQQLLDLAKAAGATVVDPFAALCNGDVCRITSATGRPMYKDKGHLNPDWVVNHASFIDATVPN